MDDSTNDGIVPWWFSLVSSEVYLSVVLNLFRVQILLPCLVSTEWLEATGVVVSRFEGVFLSVARGTRLVSLYKVRIWLSSIFRFVFHSV